MIMRYGESLAGRRVEIHPRYDAWMAGDRFGEVVKVTPRYITVKMDRSGRTRRVANDSETGLQRVIGGDGEDHSPGCTGGCSRC